ncbi:hypothetical protein [Saccharomonospora saliphila]|uniref:hypothetical protein n=1 Tax=Saccharomonospora saliphila TaxID=369829 RepID=UPI00035C20F1|nr:hypothetical protein [Saccharomonospora saliphila]
MKRTEAGYRCTALVDDVLRRTGVPEPWDINAWLDRLERVRGRRIDLCALTFSPGSATGAWRAHRDHDVIAYPANTASFHQDHIILHEVGHMLFEHSGRCPLSDERARRLAPSLGAAAFTHLLDRVHNGGDEYEAERFAHLLHARVTTRAVPRPRHHRPPEDAGTADTLARLTTTLDDP